MAPLCFPSYGFPILYAEPETRYNPPELSPCSAGPNFHLPVLASLSGAAASPEFILPSICGTRLFPGNALCAPDRCKNSFRYGPGNVLESLVKELIVGIRI